MNTTTTPTAIKIYFENEVRRFSIGAINSVQSLHAILNTTFNANGNYAVMDENNNIISTDEQFQSLLQTTNSKIIRLYYKKAPQHDNVVPEATNVEQETETETETETESETESETETKAECEKVMEEIFKHLQSFGSLAAEAIKKKSEEVSEKYEKELKQLEEMGFTNTPENLIQLELNQGNIERCIPNLQHCKEFREEVKEKHDAAATKWAKELEQLKELGFAADSKAKLLLEVNKGNVQQVVEQLMFANQLEQQFSGLGDLFSTITKEFKL